MCILCSVFTPERPEAGLAFLAQYSAADYTQYAHTTGRAGYATLEGQPKRPLLVTEVQLPEPAHPRRVGRILMRMLDLQEDHDEVAVCAVKRRTGEQVCTLE